MDVFKTLGETFNISSEKVNVAKVWLVTWNGRFGVFHGDWKYQAKSFFNKEDAIKFKESLEQAQKILHYTEDIHITIEEQE